MLAKYALLLALLLSVSALSPEPGNGHPETCQKTKVAILGAGIAGIAAAKSLHENGVDDFVIVEYNEAIGGRCRHTTFGKERNGDPYTVELGANWIQGTVSGDGSENPIWTLAMKSNLRNQPSNSSSILTYDKTGQVNYLDKLTEFDDFYSQVEQAANMGPNKKVESQKLLSSKVSDDVDLRSSLAQEGYHPENNPQRRTAEWYKIDYEYGQSPELSDRAMTLASYNSTFRHFSPQSHFSLDPRGFSTTIHTLAAPFLSPTDPRLHLNTIVRNIASFPTSITITNNDGTCIVADHAITTFSLGVLKSPLVTFTPPLPPAKLSAINKMTMGTYTKIFLQFPKEEIFWDQETEFFLYASPHTRGYYPLFQSLSHASFLPDSGILIATVTSPFSSIVESQPIETTKVQVLEVLREMFGEENVSEPEAFMLPRWGEMEWARGSFSNWPPGFTVEEHEALRGDVGGRIWFAGEHTSRSWYGYLHGAFDEGRAVGERVAECVKNADSLECRGGKFDDV